MIKTISKIGNSQGLMLDSALMELAHLKAGDQVNVEVHAGGTVTLTPLRFSPATMCSRLRPSNRAVCARPRSFNFPRLFFRGLSAMNAAWPRRGSLIIAPGLPAIPSSTIGALAGVPPAAGGFCPP